MAVSARRCLCHQLVGGVAILRSHFYHFTCRSMRQLYEAMLYDLAKEVPLPTLGSS